MQEQHTITVLVDNKPGVLARVSGLFARRGYNIESLTVSITDDPAVSRMTIVVAGDADTLEQITKQLHKLIDVLKVYDYLDTPMLSRELALIKVNAEPASGDIVGYRDAADGRLRVCRISAEDRRIQVDPGRDDNLPLRRKASRKGVRERSHPVFDEAVRR